MQTVKDILRNVLREFALDGFGVNQPSPVTSILLMQYSAGYRCTNEIISALDLGVQENLMAYSDNGPGGLGSLSLTPEGHLISKSLI